MFMIWVLNAICANPPHDPDMIGRERTTAQPRHVACEEHLTSVVRAQERNSNNAEIIAVAFMRTHYREAFFAT